MPTDTQILMLLRQRGSVRMMEMKQYFNLVGGWFLPLTVQMTALVASGVVYRDVWGSYLLSFAG